MVDNYYYFFKSTFLKPNCVFYVLAISSHNVTSCDYTECQLGSFHQCFSLNILFLDFPIYKEMRQISRTMMDFTMFFTWKFAEKFS